MKVRYVKEQRPYTNKRLTLGCIYESSLKENGNYDLIDNRGKITSCFQSEIELIEDQQTDIHYNNENGSLYLFAEQHGLNAWEFDIIKRITRCRKKGQFIEDLEKTKRVIDLYIKEYDTTANR